MNAPIESAAGKAAKTKSKRGAIIGVLAGVLVVGAGAAFVLLRPAALPPPSDTAAVVKLAASDRWSKLTPAQLDSYYNEFEKMSWPDRMKAMSETTLTDEERQTAMRNFFSQYGVRQARKYVALSPEEQQKELDKQIDEMERGAALRRMMPNFGGGTTRPGGPGGPGGGGPGGGGGGRGGWGDPARQKERMESMPPGDRAAMSKYFADMAKRRAERGLPNWGGPGGGTNTGGAQRPGTNNGGGSR
jgi:hypothetical protein